MNDEKIVAFKECASCKQALKVVEVEGQHLILELASGERHICWNLPQDANLLVLED